MSDYIDINFMGSSKDDNILSDPLELFMQEIFLAVQMGPNTIWGINESINLNRYVFNKHVTLTQIRNEMLSYFGRNCAHAAMFNYSLSVELINHNNKDLIYITIKVLVPDITGEQQEYIQKFLLGT